MLQTINKQTKMAAPRFVQVTEADIAGILANKDAINTKKSTKVAVKCFEDFLRESGRSTDFLECTISDLDDALREFYIAARKTDGSLFKKSALQNIRYGLKRHIKDNRNVDILSDPAFIKSNEVFKAMSVELKRNGLGKIDHHPPISEQDLLKLYSAETLVFDTNTPYGLQRKVWFELTLYLCRRGRENLREMNKSTFALETDDLIWGSDISVKQQTNWTKTTEKIRRSQ